MEACTLLKWKAPTPIQREAVPLVLQGLFESNKLFEKFTITFSYSGKDVIGLAETGSGKTGYGVQTLLPIALLTRIFLNYRAFTLPLLQSLLENPQRLFGLVLTPTRELAFQIAEQIEALG